MRALSAGFLLALSGCSVALSGHQSTAGGSAVQTTAAATSGHASIGAARVGASFGMPAPAGSSGAQIGFSRGASTVLILGLIIAEVVNYFSTLSEDGTRFTSGAGRPIAATCSCYGYQPGPQLTAAPGTE